MTARRTSANRKGPSTRAASVSAPHRSVACSSTSRDVQSGSNTLQAAAAGHDVTAYLREPGRLTPRPRLTTTAGDVRDAGILAQAMHGTDVVVSTLGIGKAQDPGDLITDSTRAIVQAAERSGTQRVVIMSAFGVRRRRVPRQGRRVDAVSSTPAAGRPSPTRPSGNGSSPAPASTGPSPTPSC